MTSSTRAASLLAVGAASISALSLAVAQPESSSSASRSNIRIADRSVPEGWQEGTVSPEAGVVARTWSDPADGCHLVDFAVPAPETAGLGPLKQTLDAELAKEGLALTETQNGSWRLTGPGVTGIATIGMQVAPVRSATLTTCYWNEREPARCQAACQDALATAKPTP